MKNITNQINEKGAYDMLRRARFTFLLKLRKQLHVTQLALFPTTCLGNAAHGLMGHAIVFCNLTKWLFILNDTTQDIRPLLSRNTIERFRETCRKACR